MKASDAEHDVMDASAFESDHIHAMEINPLAEAVFPLLDPEHAMSEEDDVGLSLFPDDGDIASMVRISLSEAPAT